MIGAVEASLRTSSDPAWFVAAAAVVVAMLIAATLLKGE